MMFSQKNRANVLEKPKKTAERKFHSKYHKKTFEKEEINKFEHF